MTEQASLAGRPRLTRELIIARAQFWVDQGVHYLAHDGGQWPATASDPDGRPYRADCSGYVAMAWAAQEAPDTCDFDAIGFEIPATELQSGDAVLWKGGGGYGDDGGHVLIFEHWLNDRRDSYMSYELTGGSFARRHGQPYPHLRGDRGYLAWRSCQLSD
jgi:hypothetical protein